MDVEKELESIHEYQAANQFPPSIRDLTELFGYSTTSVIATYLKSLEDDGLIARRPRQARTIVLTADGIKKVSR